MFAVEEQPWFKCLFDHFLHDLLEVFTITDEMDTNGGCCCDTDIDWFVMLFSTLCSFQVIKLGHHEWQYYVLVSGAFEGAFIISDYFHEQLVGMRPLDICRSLGVIKRTPHLNIGQIGRIIVNHEKLPRDDREQEGAAPGEEHYSSRCKSRWARACCRWIPRVGRRTCLHQTRYRVRFRLP